MNTCTHTQIHIQKKYNRNIPTKSITPASIQIWPSEKLD